MSDTNTAPVDGAAADAPPLPGRSPSAQEVIAVAMTGRAQATTCIESTCRNYGNYGQPVPGKFEVRERCNVTHGQIKCRCGTDFVACSAVVHD